MCEAAETTDSGDSRVRTLLNDNIADMLTVAGRRLKTSRRTDEMAWLPSRAPGICERIVGMDIGLFDGWYLIQEWIRLELAGRGEGGVETGIVVVVGVSHWNSMRGIEKSGERSCCERWSNGVGWVRKNHSLELSVA